MPPRPATPAPGQMDLLAWQPPQPVARFDPPRVRAASLPVQIGRAVAEALRDAAAAGICRDEVARRMGAILGTTISKSMLDAYASQAREEHTISLARFVALIQATGDRRLLQLLAEPLGWAVIDRADLARIELSDLREHADEIARRMRALEQQTRQRRA